ncbi:MAG: PepSY domain-containing protein [Oscillospiraceae bacterium]|nr:PepSY domain-containing protein [Oscillospiraceae bacterium]
MKHKYMLCFAALCIAASLAGCRDKPAADLTNSITSAAESGTVSEIGLIDLEDAENAALAHAGIAEAEARITKAELDRDNGNYEYEIEFTAKNYKYEYDINAEDGSVLKFSKEAIASVISENVVQSSAPAETTISEVSKQTETSKPEVTTSAVTQNSAVPSPAEKIITAEEAKSAALKHAGFTASEVTFTKAELDYDDGIAEYDIEFNSALNEYEYEINAATGMVIKYSKEALDIPAMKNSQDSIISD